MRYMADMIRALLLLVLTLWAVECQDYSEPTASFSRTYFSMSCPFDDVSWSRMAGSYSPIPDTTVQDKILTQEYNDKTKGGYKCSTADGKESNYFYVLGKVCENCYELDATLLIGIIVGDLLVTGGIIIFIYNCAQRKAGASPPPSAAGRSTNRNAPSVPDRDYEALNLGTRDNSTYAVAGMNRNG